MSLLLYIHFIIAPTGAPLNVSVTPVPPDTLSVMWQPPDCQLWNSHRLTNYTLHYSPILTLSQGGEEVSIQVVDGLCFNLTGLTNFTDYRVSVYASNGEGRGPTSQEVVTSLITGESYMARQYMGECKQTFVYQPMPPYIRKACNCPNAPFVR